MFIRCFPYNTTHITTVWAHTTNQYTTGKQLSGPMFFKRFPCSPNKTTHMTTVWVLTTTVHLIGTVWTYTTNTLLESNFQAPNYWKTTFRTPCFSRVSLFPYKRTHMTTMWALTTTMYLTGKLLSGPHVYKGIPYKITHIATVWVHTTTIFHITIVWAYTTNTRLATHNHCLHYWDKSC